MIGRARTGAAVTIINSLFNGIGAAVGIDLSLEVLAELGPPESSAGEVRVSPTSSDTPLVRATVQECRRRFGPPATLGVRIDIRSEIPTGVGLKSSSAVGTALVLALARAAGREVPVEGAARLAAQIARSSGQSATGAFDDSCASASEGIWVTDNARDAVLFRRPSPSAAVLLSIPAGSHPPSPRLVGAFRAHPPSDALALLRQGEIWQALERNSRAVEAVMGYPEPSRADLHRAGALAVGITGLGPAVAVVAPEDHAGEVRAVLERSGAEVRSTRFRTLLPGAAGS